MDPGESPVDDEKRGLEKEVTKQRRRAERAEAQLENYERIVDRTQHLLNTRIAEVETARAALAARTQELELSEQRTLELSWVVHNTSMTELFLHSDEILRELGLDDATIAALREQQAIR